MDYNNYSLYKLDLQNLQINASFLIISAQNGHFFSSIANRCIFEVWYSFNLFAAKFAYS